MAKRQQSRIHQGKRKPKQRDVSTIIEFGISKIDPFRTMLGLGRVKPVWLAEIGTRTAESFDGDNWTFLPSLSRAKVGAYLDVLELSTKCFTIALKEDPWMLGTSCDWQ